MYLKKEGLHVEATINNSKIEMEIDKNFHFMEVHPSCFEEINDLLTIGEYNEPSILHVIRQRFYDDKICTLVGNNSILYINPCKTIEKNEQIKSYFNQFKEFFLKIQFEIFQKNDFPFINSDNLYYFTHKAYFDMVTQRQKVQNFIISGEPSSGKSYAFKSILNYLSFLSVEQASKYDNPLDTILPDINNMLEAFGNAANNMNVNSTRFTKFFDIYFNDKGKIISTKIYCYFLEKSRVVKSSPGEANFHIFYQIIHGSNDFEKKIYHIKDVNYFKYLKNGHKRSSSEKEDSEKFQKIKELFLKLKYVNTLN
jgi:myosin heavy subunit